MVDYYYCVKKTTTDLLFSVYQSIANKFTMTGNNNPVCMHSATDVQKATRILVLLQLMLGEIFHCIHYQLLSIGNVVK